jgi:hypothetical protein
MNGGSESGLDAASIQLRDIHHSEKNMRKILALAITLIVVVALTASLTAQNKDAKLTGKVTCAKCDLKTEKDCATVVVVKEGGKDVIYYFDEKAHKANHDAVCQTGKEGTVTGTVSEKGGKKYITVAKVDFKK